jgi:hypothetical protein
VQTAGRGLPGVVRGIDAIPAGVVEQQVVVIIRVGVMAVDPARRSGSIKRRRRSLRRWRRSRRPSWCRPARLVLAFGRLARHDDQEKGTGRLQLRESHASRLPGPNHDVARARAWPGRNTGRAGYTHSRRTGSGSRPWCRVPHGRGLR